MAKAKKNHVHIKDLNKKITILAIMIVAGLIGAYTLGFSFAAKGGNGGGHGGGKTGSTGTTSWSADSKLQNYYAPPTTHQFSYEKSKGKTYLLHESSNTRTHAWVSVGDSSETLSDFLNRWNGSYGDLCITGSSSNSSNSMDVSIRAYGSSDIRTIGSYSFTNEVTTVCKYSAFTAQPEGADAAVVLNAIAGSFKVQKVELRDVFFGGK